MDSRVVSSELVKSIIGDDEVSVKVLKSTIKRVPKFTVYSDDSLLTDVVCLDCSKINEGFVNEDTDWISEEIRSNPYFYAFDLINVKKSSVFIKINLHEDNNFSFKVFMLDGNLEINLINTKKGINIIKNSLLYKTIVTVVNNSIDKLRRYREDNSASLKVKSKESEFNFISMAIVGGQYKSLKFKKELNIKNIKDSKFYDFFIDSSGNYFFKERRELIVPENLWIKIYYVRHDRIHLEVSRVDSLRELSFITKYTGICYLADIENTLHIDGINDSQRDCVMKALSGFLSDKSKML